MHVDQSDKRGGYQELVRNGIEKYAETCDLQAATREIAVGPISGGGQQENEHPPDFKPNGIAENIEIRAAGKENDNKDWNEEDAEQRQSIRQVHKSSTLAAYVY